MGTIIPTAAACSPDLLVGPGRPVERRPAVADRLTAREATIARMLVEGMPERLVAAELFMSVVALRAQEQRICTKLDIPSVDGLATVIGRGTMLRFDTEAAGDHRDADDRERVAGHRLTQQEAAVLRLTREGMDERQVAAELFIGIAAVGSHLAHIRVKLDVEVSARPGG